MQVCLKGLIERLMPIAKMKQGEPIRPSYLKALIEKCIPADMKGDMDDGLWNSIRDPATFLSTVRGASKAVKDLLAHFFEKAESALEQLAELLWKPILEKCQALQSYFDSGAPRTKPVRSSIYSFCVSLS